VFEGQNHRSKFRVAGLKMLLKVKVKSGKPVMTQADCIYKEV